MSEEITVDAHLRTRKDWPVWMISLAYYTEFLNFRQSINFDDMAQIMPHLPNQRPTAPQLDSYIKAFDNKQQETYTSHLDEYNALKEVAKRPIDPSASPESQEQHRKMLEEIKEKLDGVPDPLIKGRPAPATYRDVMEEYTVRSKDDSNILAEWQDAVKRYNKLYSWVNRTVDQSILTSVILESVKDVSLQLLRALSNEMAPSTSANLNEVREDYKLQLTIAHEGKVGQEQCPYC